VRNVWDPGRAPATGVLPVPGQDLWQRAGRDSRAMERRICPGGFWHRSRQMGAVGPRPDGQPLGSAADRAQSAPRSGPFVRANR
jgi:hypothetical protein